MIKINTSITLVLLAITASLSSSYVLVAQNLVPNFSFEDTLSCPTGPGQLDVATSDWYSPTDYAADFFHPCANLMSGVNVPNNSYGNQSAADSSSYGGFLGYAPNDSRSYLATQLDAPLVVGETYCVSFDISFADFTYIAIEDIGLYFSTTAVNVINGGIHLGFTPHISNSNGIVSDKNNWITVTGTFTPNAPYEHILIGNFASNANTNSVDLSVPGIDGPLSEQAYYYVDNVSVVGLPDINVTFNPDSLVCEGGTVDLTAFANPNATYQWTTLNDPFTPLSNSDLLQYTVNNTTSFIVTAQTNTCVQRDTVTVYVSEIPIPDFEVVSTCAGYNTSFFDMSANVTTDATYAWDFNNDGLTDATSAGGASYIFATPGVYPVTLSVTNQGTGCLADTTINITIAADCDPCADPTNVQNIVPNANLEFYNSCPTGLTENGFNIDAVSWYAPTDATPDFYHQCANGEVAIPNNVFGTQNPLSGSGYLGVFAYGNNYREYISAQLLQDLVPGEQYCVSFNVSLADTVGVAIDNMGLFFSTDSINVNTQNPLYFSPQVSNPAGNSLTDTDNWMNISGMYMATDTMGFITIGNFVDDASTDTSTIANITPPYDIFSYYYIDDIVVSPIPDLLDDAVTNLTSCVNDNDLLVANADFCSYAWFDVDNPIDTLSTLPSISVTNDTASIKQFVVVAEYGVCSISDTVTITYIPYPEPDFGILQNCAGAVTAFLDSSTNVLPGALYEWDFTNDGTIDSNADVITAYTYENTGTYTVALTITNPNGCQTTTTQTITITDDCEQNCNADENIVLNYSFENTVCPSGIGQIDSTEYWASPLGSIGSNCSIFSSDCIDVYYLPALINPDGSTTYNIQVTNNCSQSFFYALFELPTGVLPVSPSNGDTYTGVISSYDVLVPHTLAYTGILFDESLSSGAQSGETELFSFTLPAGTPYQSSFNAEVQISNSANFNYTFNISDSSNNNCGAASVFSACAEGSNVGVVSNLYGSQLPLVGDAYAGIIAYSPNDDPQFIGGQVSPPMVVGQTYCAKMYVSLSDSSSFAVNELGMLFSTNTQIATVNPSITPQVNANSYIIEQNDWVEISTTFVADSAYQHLSIGNFGTSNLYIGGADSIAYYYIDNVSIIPVDIEMPNDTTICRGETVSLTAMTNTCDYYWAYAEFPTTILSTDTIVNVSPADTTTYIFVGNNGSCTIIDSVTVNVLPLPSLLVDGIAATCINEPLQLDVQSDADVFTWESSPYLNDTTLLAPTATIDVIGLYTFYVTATNSSTGCSRSDSLQVKVNPLPIADAGADTIYICAGDSINLNATGGNVYSWQPTTLVSDSTVADPLVSTADTTTFYVTVGNSFTGCVATDSVVLIAQQPYVTTNSAINLCAGDTAVLTPTGIPPAAVSYQWIPNNNLSNDTIVNPTTYTTTDIIYTLYYTDELGCEGQSTVEVDITPVPNAGPDLAICEGGSIQLGVSSGGVNYVWQGANLNNNNTQFPIATPDVTTDYVVEVTYPGAIGNCVDTDTITVFVNSTGFADAGADVIICAGDSIQLNAIGGDSYLWTSDPTLSNDTIANPYVNPTVTTAYFVTVTSNVTGCSSTDTVVVAIAEPEPPTINTPDDIVYCAEPLTPIEICFDITYDGCETLLAGIDTQLGSNVVFTQDTCFTYESAFDGVRADTIALSLCADQANGICDTMTAIVVNCDEPPFWPVDTLFQTTCVDTDIQLLVPQPNDPDADDVLTTSIGTPTAGTAVLDDTGIFTTITYTPPSGSTGINYLEVYVCDSLYISNQCDTLVYSIEVIPNTAPTTSNITISTNFETSVNVCPIFSDVDGDNVFVNVSDNPDNGIASLPNDTCIVYTPDAGFVGTDTIGFTVCDACNYCSTANIFVTVLPPPNVPPVINDTLVVTPYETGILVCPDMFDSDNGPLPLILDTVSVPTSGVITIVNDTCLNFVPNPGFSGTAIIGVQANDGEDTDDANIIIMVEPPVNQAPIVADTMLITNYNEAVFVCPDIIEPDGDDYTMQIVTGPANGSAVMPNGDCIIYDPNDGFEGLDSLQVTVCDNAPEPLCDTATIYITVNPKPNEAPIVTDQTVIYINTLPNTIDICLNIIEPDDEPYTTTGDSDTGLGTFVFNNDSCFTYTPTPSFTAPNIDTIYIEVCDTNNLCGTGIVIIQLVENSPPMANDSTVITPYETPTLPICIPVTEPDGEDYTVSISAVTVNGTAVLDGDTCLIYTPNNGFVGQDSVVLEICDASNLCTTSTIYIEVLPPDDPPAAPNVFVATLVDTDVEVCLDISDPQNENATITNVVIEANNLATQIVNDSCVLISPDAGYVGTQNIVVEICDEEPTVLCNTVTISVTVVAPCDNELVYNCVDTDATNEFCVDFCLLSNGGVNIAESSSQNGGTITTGTTFDCFNYTPSVGFNGIDTLTIVGQNNLGLTDTLLMAIQVGCAYPDAVNDASVFVQSGTTITINVLANDTDPCGDDLTTTAIANTPLFGTATIVGNAIEYTANPGASGTDTLWYVACNQCTNPAPLCDTAQVIVNVSANLPPLIEDITETTTEETPIVMCLTITEPEGEEITSVTIGDAPDNGTISIEFATDTCVVYTPNPDFIGTDTMTVIVCDENGNCNTGQIVVEVEEVPNDPPTISDESPTIPFGEPSEICFDISDPENDAVSLSLIIGEALNNVTVINDSCILYTPTGCFTGVDDFSVVACDSFGNCDTSNVVVTVAENQPPTAPNGFTVLVEGQSTIPCLNINEPDGNEVVATIITTATNGIVGIINDTCMSYQSVAGFIGTEIIEIEICDEFADTCPATNACTTITYQIDIVPDNQAPIVEPLGPIVLGPDETDTSCLTFSDPDGDGVSLDILTVDPPLGTVSIDENGCITFEANQSATETIIVTVELCDDASPQACTTTEVTYIINLPPVVSNQTVTTPQNTPIEVCLDANDPDGNSIEVIISTLPDNGSATIAFTPDTCITYTPDPTFVGTDTIYISVCDEPYGACTEAFIVVTVIDGLVAENDEATTENDIPLDVTVLDNDLFPNVDDLDVTITTNPNNGTAVVNADGSITYTPNSGFVGTDTLYYQICDPDLGCAEGILVITVADNLNAVDDAVLTTPINTNLVVDILANDDYPDETDLVIDIIDGADNGGFTSNGLGIYEYVPDPDFVGTDTIVYVITYPGFGSDTATIIIEVLPAWEPEPIVAVTDSVSINATSNVNIDVLGNDSYNDTLAVTVIVSIITAPSNGVATVNADNSISYTPSSLANDSLVYVICYDNDAFCDTATVYITGIDESCTPFAYAGISPNGDGLNDEFVIENLDCNGNGENELMVFNRWGDVVYKTENYGNGNWWNGEWQNTGNTVPAGTYFYILSIPTNDFQLQGYIEIK